MAKKATQKPITIPAKLFAGKTVIIAGRLKGYPDKPDVSNFLRTQGARFSTTPTKKTDLILLGEGHATTKRKANKLIESGLADIEYLNDPIELVDYSHEELALAITDPTNLERMLQWPAWVWRELDFDGFDYSDRKIGLKLSEPNWWSIDDDFFAKCKFDRATLSNLSMGGEERTASCTFKQTKFENVTFFSAPVHLVDIQGTNLSLRHNKNAIVNKATIDGFVLYSPEQCKFAGIRAKNLTFEKDIFFGSLNCEFKKFQVEGWIADSTDFRGCTFDGCVFDSGELKKTRFVKCKFSNTKFRNLEISNVVFRDCEFKATQFDSSLINDLNFEDSKVTSLTFKKCTSQFVSLNEKQLAKTKGLTEKDAYTRLDSTAVKQLAKVINSAEAIEISINVKHGKHKTKFEVKSDWYSEKYLATEGSNEDCLVAARGSVRTRKRDMLNTNNGLNWLAIKAQNAEPDFGSLKIKTKNSNLKGKPLKELVVEALTDVFQTAKVSVAEVVTKQRAKAKSKKQQVAEIVALLRSGNVKAINAARDEMVKLKSFRKLDLKKAKLRNVDLSGLVLFGCDFSGSDLQGANFTGADCRSVNFDDCQLQRAAMVDTDLYLATLKNANLRGANLDEANLGNAKLNNADLSNATIRDATVHGADLSGAKLTRTRLNESGYDETTIFPSNTPLRVLQTMINYGTAAQPVETQRQFQPVKGKLDFPTFLERLRLLTDNARMNKTLELLEKQPFHLYVDSNAKRLSAVVVNPKQIEKPYLAQISADGKFSCCSHKLNPCGGLRGALCKHLLVMLIGVVKAKKITAAKADKWINASKVHRPELDKPKMQELLDSYQRSERWEPIITSPDDFQD